MHGLLSYRSRPQSASTHIVRVLTDDPGFGVSAGDEFEAVRYWLDPREKWTLLRRLSDGFDPECNQYAHDIEVVRPIGVHE